MLGIVEDQDDIAFDNATWYLNSQPELASGLWEMALDQVGVEGEGPKLRCLNIARHVVQQSQAGQVQVIVGLPKDSLPLPILAAFEHLPSIVEMLVAPPAERTQITSTFGLVEERFGLLRACALDLIVDLIETRNTTICEEIANLDVLPIAFEKFFVYKWNSALHSTVLRLVEYVFDVESVGVALVSLQRKLLIECDFLTVLMDAYENTTPDEVEVKELDSQIHSENQEPMDPLSAAVEQKLVAASKTVGYISAVVEMALCFKHASNSLALRELLDEVHPRAEGEEEGSVSARWEAFSRDVLERVEDMSPEKRCLGGEKPRPNPTCGQM